MAFAMTNRNRFLLWLTALILFFGTESAKAASTAEDYVRAQHSELITLLTQPKSAARDQKVSAIMDRVFDYDDLARRSLGDEWGQLSEAERNEFKGLLEQLVKQSYRRHLDKTNGWEVNYSSSSTVKDGVRVPTVAKHKSDKRKEPVSIDYLLHEVKGQWRVFDIVVEGSSLVGNYQSQFKKVIKKKGFAELVTRMKRRIAKGTD